MMKQKIHNILAISAIFFLLMFVEQATIARLLPQGRPPSQEVINMMIGLANNPILLAIWLGPVVKWLSPVAFRLRLRLRPTMSDFGRHSRQAGQLCNNKKTYTRELKALK